MYGVHLAYLKMKITCFHLDLDMIGTLGKYIVPGTVARAPTARAPAASASH
jgi:hypothetical protein